MISVIIPVYNVSAYLDRCIRSIVTQDFKDIEIILVDDGSTDISGSICDEWTRKDSRIIVIHKSNSGLSDARNTGINISKGEYLSFIDSDDFIYPEYLTYLYNLIQSSNADMSVCQAVNVDENDNVLSIGGMSIDKTIFGNEKCMEAFISNTAIDTTAWRKLYRSSLFKNTKIRYPVGKYHEDIFTTYRIIAQCNKIVIGSKALYAYRQRTGSIVNSSFSLKHLDAIYGNIERYDFIHKHYPLLEHKASKGVIHAANICVFRMAKAKIDPNPDIIDILKPLYKKHINNYLKSNCRFASKIFAIAARINLGLFIKILSKIF